MLRPSLLLLVATAVAAGSAAAQRTLMTAYGNAAGARFGAALARIADVDGDHFPDLVVGSPYFTPNANLAHIGATTLVNGRTGAYRYQFGPLPAANAQSGAAVVATGDLDGDGWPDFLVGAPGYTTLTNIPDIGAVTAHSGRTGALLWTRSAVGTNLRQFGTSVAGLGDVDGDGVPDFLVGSPSCVTGANALASIVDGRTGAFGSSIAIGTATSQCGISVATLSDLNGDGKPEVAVGEPRFNFNGDSGRIRVIDPSHSFTPTYQLFQNFGYDVGAGQLVANAGDVDGDGKDDLLVGYRGSQSSGPWTPRVGVFSGSNGAALGTVWYPNAVEASFGAAMAGIGDYDGDGRDDFAVGAPYANSGAGVVVVYSGRTLGVIATILGDAGSHFGSALCRLGDYDGDGRADFAVGAPEFVQNGQAVGRVTVHGQLILGHVTMFGTGCAGTGALGLSRVAGPFQIWPFPGSNVVFQGTNLGGAAVSLWLWGFSATNSPAGPLPLDLSPFGYAGCNLLVRPDVVQTWPGGDRTVTLPIPNVPTLAGVRFFLQLGALGAGYPNGLGLSNAADILIGNL